MDESQIELMAVECQTFLNRLRECYEVAGAVLLVDFQYGDMSGTVQQLVGPPSSAYGLCRRFAIEQESLWGEQAVMERYADMEEGEPS